MKTHFIDTRLKVNAGISFPMCKAGEKMLDLDAAHLPLTDNIHEVTCKHCLRAHRSKYAF